MRGRPIHATEAAPRSVSVVVAAFNEEENIGRRLDEMTILLEAADLDGEVIVVTDGSMDATAAVARAHSSPMVRVLELPVRVGKAAALSEGCAAAVHEILVFADVRQIWAVDALPRMLSTFADPTVGAVSGDLIVQPSVGVLGGVGAYWRFEKWLRRQESRLWSGVGATGAVAAPCAAACSGRSRAARFSTMFTGLCKSRCRVIASSTTIKRTPSTACPIGRATSFVAKYGRFPAVCN